MIKHWTDEENQRLLELKRAGKKVWVIAKELGRTESAVSARLVVLKQREIQLRQTPALEIMLITP
jgi:DNA-binding NarL/FixJ family response regulator